jgi:hypothetical protein
LLNVLDLGIPETDRGMKHRVSLRVSDMPLNADALCEGGVGESTEAGEKKNAPAQCSTGRTNFRGTGQVSCSNAGRQDSSRGALKPQSTALLRNRIPEHSAPNRRVGPFHRALRRNIGVLRGFCRPASGKSRDRYYVFTTGARDRKRTVPNSLIEKRVGSPG